MFNESIEKEIENAIQIQSSAYKMDLHGKVFAYMESYDKHSITICITKNVPIEFTAILKKSNRKIKLSDGDSIPIIFYSDLFALKKGERVHFIPLGYLIQFNNQLDIIHSGVVF